MEFSNDCWLLVLTHLSLTLQLRMRRVCQSWFTVIASIQQQQKILTIWDEFVGDVDNYRMYRRRHNRHLLDMEELTPDKSKTLKAMFPNLRQVHMCNIKTSLAALQTLFSAYAGLERVSIYKVTGIEQGLDSVLHLLANSCRQLKYLQIVTDPDENTEDRVLHELALFELRGLSSLEGLHLRVNLAEPSPYDFLREMKSLKVLKARRRTMDLDPFVKVLEHCGNQLTELAIKLESEVAERFLGAINEYAAESLKLLLLKYEITDLDGGELLDMVHVHQICKLKNLVSLLMFLNATVQPSFLTDSCLEKIMQNCKGIKSFGLQYVGTGITEKTAQNMVTYWPQLLSLEIEVIGIRDNWLTQLKKLKQLHFLDIRWAKPSNCIVEIVRESRTLRTLMIRIDISSLPDTALVENILDEWDRHKRHVLLHISTTGSPDDIGAVSRTYVQLVKVPETISESSASMINMQKFLLEDMFVFPRTS